MGLVMQVLFGNWQRKLWYMAEKEYRRLWMTGGDEGRCHITQALGRAGIEND